MSICICKNIFSPIHTSYIFFTHITSICKGKKRKRKGRLDGNTVGCWVEKKKMEEKRQRSMASSKQAAGEEEGEYEKKRSRS